MLKDLQSEKDERNIFISNIGICDYKLPINLIIGNEIYHSICRISSNVVLDKTSRGAHLSRIIQSLNEHIYGKNIRIEDFDIIREDIIKRSETIGASLEFLFDIIIAKETPISKNLSYNTVQLKIKNERLENSYSKSLSISLIGTMLCPCSKEISKYGAHNQKCLATVTLYDDYDSSLIPNIIEIINQCFSANVYSTVKREDEKYLTETAYENPKFSEDLIRDLLLNISKIYSGRVVAELINYESIHEHNVYAKGEINGTNKKMR